MRPEDAVEAARQRAAEVRARGGYADDLSGFEIEPVEVVTRDRLLDWSLIEPDDARIRSTRALGAPITWIKRQLARALRQQQGQLASDQTRFNLHMVVYASRLEERIAELEAEVRRLRDEPGSQP